MNRKVGGSGDPLLASSVCACVLPVHSAVVRRVAALRRAFAAFRVGPIVPPRAFSVFRVLPSVFRVPPAACGVRLFARPRVVLVPLVLSFV